MTTTKKKSSIDCSLFNIYKARDWGRLSDFGRLRSIVELEEARSMTAGITYVEQKGVAYRILVITTFISTYHHAH